jgi:hypothetical protein
MPTLTYIAIAFDGSPISRERDELTMHLDIDKATHDAMTSTARRSLNTADNSDSTLTRKTMPAICDAVQSELCAARHPYSVLRLLLGLPDAPTAGRDPARPDRLTTGIPGTDEVDLQPLRDRARQVQLLRGDRKMLTEALATIPAHPWGATGNGVPARG